jgi:hypothetical protein
MATTNYDFDYDVFDDNEVSADDLQSIVNPLHTSGSDQKDDASSDNKSNPSSEGELYLQEEQRKLREALFGNNKPTGEEEKGEDDNEAEDNTTEDTNPDSSKNEDTNDTNSSENTDDDELDLFSILKEENLLYIPDDFEGEFTEETLQQLKEYTFQVRDNEIIESRREEFQEDPYKLMLFDYFMTAGLDADIPKFIDTQDYLRSFETLDVESESDQKYLLKQYLLEGLDPNIPYNKMRIEKIDQDIEAIISNYEGSEKAQEAKDYFIRKGQELLSEELNKANQIKHQKEEEEKRRELNQQKWHTEFQTVIKNNSKLSDAQKRSLLEEQYSVVNVNESELPVWYAKELMIKSNPELYSQYLEWLNTSFDLSTGQFKGNTKAQSDTTKVTKKILDLINKKNIQKPKGSESRKIAQTSNKNIIVDPRDMI